MEQVQLDANDIPNQSIARINTNRKTVNIFRGFKKYSHGSGVVVNKRFVLTAAHNIFSETGSWLRWAKVDLGFNQGTAIQSIPNAYKRSQVRCAKNYWWRKYNWDYGIIDLGVELNEPHISFRLPENGEILEIIGEKQSRLYLAGYPGEIHGGETLKGASCEVNQYELEGALLTYDIDTFTGNSGGPVWFEKDGEYIVAGIHVKGIGKKGAAVVLDDIRTEEIRSWM